MKIKLTKSQEEVLQFIADNCDPLDVHAITPTDNELTQWEAWVTWHNPTHGEATLVIDMEEQDWFKI